MPPPGPAHPPPARQPGRTYSAATPLGAPNLWPATVTMSAPAAPHARPLRSTFPTAWAASVWNRTDLSRHALAISKTGCTDPTSLFAVITVTRAVLGRITSITSLVETSPSSFTSTYVTEILGPGDPSPV